jgi:hypothetical protein
MSNAAVAENLEPISSEDVANGPKLPLTTFSNAASNAAARCAKVDIDALPLLFRALKSAMRD